MAGRLLARLAVRGGGGGSPACLSARVCVAGSSRGKFGFALLVVVVVLTRRSDDALMGRGGELKRRSSVGRRRVREKRRSGRRSRRGLESAGSDRINPRSL